MKALVFNGPRDIRYETFPDPELSSENSVILKVNKCSICGSDLHIYHGDQISSTNYGGSVNKFCVGHEFTGEVVEVGPDVRIFKKGDRVLAAGGTGCGKCDACRTGFPDRCRRATAFGLSNQMNGGQAEYVSVPNADRTLHIIPEGVSDEQAILLTDAMATAYFGISRTDLSPGDSVAIVGLGPIGLIGVELAYTLGASVVYAIDPVKARRDHAEALGAIALAPGDEALQTIREATQGRGVDCVFEASGARAAVDSVLKFVRAQGTVSFIGLPQADVMLPLANILYKNVTLRAGVAPVSHLWGDLLPLVQKGRVKAAGLFSHNMPLSEGTEAYRMFDAREDGVLKIMLNID